jgi:anti-anti-sigma regulatory factor
VNPAPSILVGTAQRTVWIRVEGKGSFQNSTGMRAFAKEMMNRGYREFVVDLGHCPVMDSTFMGTLAYIAQGLRELGQGQLNVIHLNERNRDLLCNLGFDQLFALEESEAPAGAQPATEEALPVDPNDKATRARTMLAAHEALVEVNPANAAKFKDVLEFLRHDLHPAR